MSKEAKEILAAFPHLSRSELWLIIEAAMLYVRESENDSEMTSPDLISEIDRRRALLAEGKVSTRPAFQVLKEMHHSI